MPFPGNTPTASFEIECLARIDSALLTACKVAARYMSSNTDTQIETRFKADRHLVTEADSEINHVLRHELQQSGEGWLSEEDPDDRGRLSQQAVWIVDPLDGTREFVDRIPEWSVSVAIAVDGRPVVGGVVNPVTGESFLGSLTTGITYNGKRSGVSAARSLRGGTILASRQEHRRGEWERFEGHGFAVRAVGSVAYKLALVAAGLAEATFTLQPKHEWDVAAGVALVLAAGGEVACPGGAPLLFNQPDTLLPGLIAGARGVWPEVMRLLA